MKKKKRNKKSLFQKVKKLKPIYKLALFLISLATLFAGYRYGTYFFRNTPKEVKEAAIEKSEHFGNPVVENKKKQPMVEKQPEERSYKEIAASVVSFGAFYLVPSTIVYFIKYNYFNHRLLDYPIANIGASLTFFATFAAYMYLLLVYFVPSWHVWKEWPTLLLLVPTLLGGLDYFFTVKPAKATKKSRMNNGNNNNNV